MPGSRIDIHTHFLPDVYRNALIASGLSKPDGIAALPRWSDAEMLATMDGLGIQKSYVSISSPGVHFGDDRAARTLARQVNEEGAWLARTYPGRFGFFASTPLPDIDGALAEIGYAFDVLGASGIIFETNFHGVYLGDQKLAVLYEELNRRRATLFLHPTAPGRSCNCGDPEAYRLGYPAPMIEYIFDTTRSVTNMVLSGVFQRFPDVRVIVPHAGAALPILAGRIDIVGPMLAPAGAPKPPSMRDSLRLLHFDLAGAPVPEMLGALLSVADPSRIHYGSDWPFTPAPVCSMLAEKLDETPLLDQATRRRIMWDNSERLLGTVSGGPALDAEIVPSADEP